MPLRYVFAIAFVLMLWGYASEMDYQEELRKACDRKGGELNGRVCVVMKGEMK